MLTLLPCSSLVIRVIFFLPAIEKGKPSWELKLHFLGVGEGGEVVLCLLFLNHLQLKIAFMPDWHILGCHTDLLLGIGLLNSFLYYRS